MRTLLVSLTLSAVLALSACGESKPAVRVSLPVEVDGSGVVPSTSELGWTVTLSACRLAARDFQFTIGGETHGSTVHLLPRLLGLLEPEAYAHPGHYAGGEVTGELAGDRILDFLGGSGTPLGQATLLTGKYHGMNFFLRRATAGELAAGDPLVGHTAHYEGTATREGTTITFRALVDLDEGTQIVGLPNEVDVTETTRVTFEVQTVTIDPYEKDTLFQKLDFAALDEDRDGHVEILPGQPAHNVLRRAVATHDHYFVRTR